MIETTVIKGYFEEFYNLFDALTPFEQATFIDVLIEKIDYSPKQMTIKFYGDLPPLELIKKEASKPLKNNNDFNWFIGSNNWLPMLTVIKY